jgi:Transcriptional regulators
MLGDLDEDVETKLVKAFLQFNKLSRFNKAETETSDQTECSGKQYNLRYSEFQLLIHIRYCSQSNPEGVTSSALSAYMQVKPPTINPLLSNLERLGLIARKPDKTDRRFVRIELTPAGLRFITEHEEKLLGKIRGLTQYLGEKKSNDLVNLMNDTYKYFESGMKK